MEWNFISYTAVVVISILVLMYIYRMYVDLSAFIIMADEIKRLNSQTGKSSMTDKDTKPIKRTYKIVKDADLDSNG